LKPKNKDYIISKFNQYTNCELIDLIFAESSTNENEVATNIVFS